MEVAHGYSYTGNYGTQKTQDGLYRCISMGIWRKDNETVKKREDRRDHFSFKTSSTLLLYFYMYINFHLRRVPYLY